MGRAKPCRQRMEIPCGHVDSDYSKSGPARSSAARSRTDACGKPVQKKKRFQCLEFLFQVLAQFLH